MDGNEAAGDFPAVNCYEGSAKRVIVIMLAAEWDESTRFEIVSRTN